ncbi:molybdopterin-dependent oxidoreductase [Pseudonocardia lacus]|uniref:molybdopterin-dependent oxidoreductase n=1 Tax=Pseudonocardia lacus TaxID=2835865 RepID=UPI001BDC3D8B|nr:molybdopterin-dependent oxidoreductase [Pseudonocardia lacus]
MTTTAEPEATTADPVLGRPFAALTGLVAVAAAIGAGQLVAGLLSPASGPFIAVGDAAVRVSPQWLVEFAKGAFGTADKPVLLVGMGVVIAALAAAGGIAARRTPGPGLVVVAGMGVLAAAAVLSSPTFAPLDLAAPGASLVVGITAFRRLHALRQQVEQAPTEGAGVSRRRVLVGSTAALGVGAVAATGIGAWVGRDVAGSRDEVTAALARAGYERAPAVPAAAEAGVPGATPFLTSNADFYRIDAALRVPQLTASDWSLRIHGMVDRELTLSFADLLARPLVERTITLLCVSNPVGGPYVSTTNFIGVDLREVLLEAGVSPDADQVLSTSSDGWTAGTPTGVLLEPDRGALLAIGMNGEALPPEHGFPVRMVVPGLYGYVSATKWVTDLEVTTFAQRQAYWLQRGWSEKGPIKTQSRIDVPRSSVVAGRVTVAGTAWSQPIGISAVEVRLDRGPWQPATLATEVGGDTWRMWRAEVDVPTGQHTLQVRAFDANGVPQTPDVRDVVPDGATGYHTVDITAA